MNKVIETIADSSQFRDEVSFVVKKLDTLVTEKAKQTLFSVYYDDKDELIPVKST